MTEMTARDRVLAAMRMEELDRPPVAVFTQSATIGQMEALDVYWPDAHFNPKLMAKLSAGQVEVLGFEAVRATFCLTAEAEALGATVDPGVKNSQPMLKNHPFKNDFGKGGNAELSLLDPEEFLQTGRPAVILKAVELLAEEYGERYAVIAGNTGPFTLAAHLVETENLVFGILSNPSDVIKWVKATEKITEAFSQALSDAGADIIQMSEPTASCDLLSPEMFNEFALPSLKKNFAKMEGAFSCLHICGNTLPILDIMIATGVDALSIEEKVDPFKAVEKVAGRAALIGNVGVVNPLMQGTPEDCFKHGRMVAQAGFNVVSPGCGLSALIKNENLQALVKAVKG